ncbi:MAG: ABC transporter permease, partial [Gemmatimonadales bacterium]
ALLLRLLRLFPDDFRSVYETEMTEQLTADYDAARAAGRIAALRYAIPAAWDLVTAGVAECMNPSLVTPYRVPTKGDGMASRISDWMVDLRQAVRALRRAPGFAFITIGTLGLAIGANAGMFSVVDTVLLRPLPYENVDRIVNIQGTAPGSQLPDEFGVSNEFFVQYSERSKLLEDAALVSSFTSTLRDGEQVERIRMSGATASLFTTLGARPVLGRLPIPSDESRVVVLSYALWQSWFGGDPKVIGKTLSVAGDNREVIGVMGREFRFPVEGTQLWFPSVIRLENIRTGRFGAGMIARMKPGVTTEALALELTALSKQLPERFGGSPSYAKIIEQHRAVVKTLEQTLLGSVSGPLWILLGAVTIVLLIACANVANLFMVRAEGRQRDLAVRRAIGAGRTQLIRHQMAEAVVVAVAAGIVATVLAIVVLPAFLQSAPPGIPRLADVHLGAVGMAYTLGAALVAALACGFIPAVRASEPDLKRLREGGRGSTRGRTWGRDALVVAQTAMALVLLIASGLLMRSFSNLKHVNPGYDTRDVFTFQIAPDRPELKDGPTFAQFQLAFMDRLRKLPGVQSVGLVENVPLNEGTSSGRWVSNESGPDGGSVLNQTFEAGDYFKTMGIKVLAGRPLHDEETLSWRGNVVISKTAAKLMWPGLDPIGRRMHTEGDSVWVTVVGVVDDVMQDDFRTAGQPLVYLPLVGPTPDSWSSSSPAIVIKTPRAEVIASDVRALVREVAPEAPMYRIFTMAGLAKDSMAALTFTMLTLGIASALALILGTVGLYGVLSYVVAHRTREIGVRMALGAGAGQVRRMVVGQGIRVVGVGVVIGIAVALLSTEALSSLLFGISALDAVTFVAMSSVLIAVGMLASYLPARRASRVDPIESLREG